MSLNKKMIVYTSAVIGTALLAVYIASRSILMGGFLELEDKISQRNIERVKNALDSDIKSLHILNKDWANWDDSYYFVQDRNQDFVEANLAVATTFANTKINAIIFVDNEGKVVYEKGYDPQKNVEVPVWQSLKSHINREDLLISHVGKDSIAGLIKLPEGIVLVSSIPILKSDATGPAKGTLVMAKLLGKEILSSLNEVSQVSTEIISLNEGPAFSEDKEVTLRRLNDNDLEVYGKIYDIYDIPIGLYKLNLDREITKEGSLALSYFLISLMLIGSIVIAGGVYFQNKTVLMPILRLSNSLNKIRMTGDLSRNVEVVGNDEIARLSADINAMLISLKDYNEASKANERALSEKLEVIEKQNKDLEKSKLAMLNLLEDEKELENAIKKEHDRLNLIISSMGEGLLVIDSSFKVVTINPVAQKLLDVSEDKIIGKKWSDLASTIKKDKATPLAERSFSKAINEGKTTVTELADDHYYKTVNGKVFPIISITAPLKVEGKIVGAVKVFRDATREHTSRKAIENEVSERTRELWEERARMYASINSLNIGFIIADKDNNIVVKNPAVAELLQINTDEVSIERIAKELAPSLDLAAHCDMCMKEKSSFGKDDIYYRDKFLRIFLAPVTSREKNNPSIGYVLLIEDITNEKQLSRAKDEFFAVASHELRTPLTAIRGNTSLIMDYYADKIQDPDLKEMVSDMHESSVRLINIVNDFLDASRLEQGKVDFKKEEVDLMGTVRSAISELTGFASERGLSIKINDSKDKLMTIADNARAYQIIVNLIGNAIKFTKSGEITVNVSKLAETAKVSVKDTGTGISPANQRLLFKKFQQAGEKVLARDVTKGTGMGLYISKLLAEGMGGKIYLEESELGRGSIFSFELPLKK